MGSHFGTPLGFRVWDKIHNQKGPIILRIDHMEETKEK